jgi:hypothetical protein
MNWKPWLYSLISAAISAAGSGVTLVIVAPDQFNFSTGLGKLGTVCGVNALLAVALYLKQSPLPTASTTVSATLTTTETKQ